MSELSDRARRAMACVHEGCVIGPDNRLIVWDTVPFDARVFPVTWAASDVREMAAGLNELADFMEGIERAEDDRQQRKEMSMLIGMLAHYLKKANPDSELPEKAMDYLRRHGLQGSPLRKDEG